MYKKIKQKFSIITQRQNKNFNTYINFVFV